MTTLDYAQLSTDALLQKFIDTAKRTGTVFGLDKKNLLQSVLALHARQNEESVREMQALGAELRRRKPIAKLRLLFEDQHPDVRGWAGPQFISVDYEWASATVTGLAYGLNTREVLAWRNRILRGTPPRPTLQEMSIPQLVERFVDACERCYGSTRFLTEEEGGVPSMTAYNKASSKSYTIAKELNARGKLGALVPLLDHRLVTVREKAGMYCLDIAADRAVATLEGINGVDCKHEAPQGSTIVSLWRMGEYEPLFE